MVKEENRDPSEQKLVSAGSARVTKRPVPGAKGFQCCVNVNDVICSHYRCSYELTGVALFVRCPTVMHTHVPGEQGEVPAEGSSVGAARVAGCDRSLSPQNPFPAQPVAPDGAAQLS